MLTQYESEAQDSGQEKSDSGSDKYQLTVHKNPMNENLKDTDLSDGPFDIIAQLLEKEKNKWKDRWDKLIVRENEVGKNEDLCKKKFMEIDDRMREIEFSGNFVEERAKDLELRQKELDDGVREIEFSRNFVEERAKELELRQKELDDGVRELELKKMAVKDDKVAAAMCAKIEEQKLKEMWERMDYKEKELERAQALCEERFKEIEDKVREVESSRKFVQERAKELELKQKELHDEFKEMESKKMEFTEIEFSRNFVEERAKELELRQKELDDGVRELELKKIAVKDDKVAAAMCAKIEEQRLKEMWERMDYKEKELERAQALCEERFKEIEDKVREVESSRKFVQERAKELELKHKELHDGFKELESKKMEFTEKTNKSVDVGCSNADINMNLTERIRFSYDMRCRASATTAISKLPAPHLYQTVSNRKLDSHETFWTCCASCKFKFMYNKVFVNKLLNCIKCYKSFTAYELNADSLPSGLHVNAVKAKEFAARTDNIAGTDSSHAGPKSSSLIHKMAFEKQKASESSPVYKMSLDSGKADELNAEKQNGNAAMESPDIYVEKDEQLGNKDSISDSLAPYLESSDDDLLVEHMHRSKSSTGGKHKKTSDKTTQKKRKKMFETENEEDVKRNKQVGMKDTTVKNIIGVKKTWKGFDDWLLMRYQPRLLTDVVQNLSEQQKNWVTETGLESLLSFGMKEYPRALGYYLVLSFEKESCSMVLGDNRIPITEDDVHEVLGFPKGAKSIEIVVDRESKLRWQSQYPKAIEAGKVTANMVYEALKGTAEVDRNFKLNFLILMSNILIQAPTNPYVRQSLLNFTGDIDKCYEYNWCEYVIECLKLAMDAWLDKPKSRYYTGSLPFLVYFYLDRVVAAKRQVRRSIPTFIGWKDSMISDRQLSEVSNGTIGHGRIAKPIRDKGSDDEESSFEVEGDSTNDEISNAGFDTFNNANEQQQS